VEYVVYGVGSSYVYEVYETLRRLQWTVRGYVANIEGGLRPHELTPLVDADDMPSAWTSAGVVFALITPGHRQNIEREARARGFTSFPVVTDPTTVVASSVEAGEGTVINAAGVVAANTTLGRFTLLNRSVSVGHDVVLDDYASLGPACVLCGGVRVGRGTFVGAGAILNPEVSIGSNSIVGSGAVVTRDVPDNVIVTGNPARVSRDGIEGYNGLPVRKED
jgi:sugar O-acyltransferase (sialic acid O-acetyltransferase NeuD family)